MHPSNVTACVDVVQPVALAHLLDNLLEDDADFTDFLKAEFCKLGHDLNIQRAEYEIENEIKLVPRIWVTGLDDIMGKAACNWKLMQPIVALHLGLPSSQCLLAIHRH